MFAICHLCKISFIPLEEGAALEPNLEVDLEKEGDKTEELDLGDKREELFGKTGLLLVFKALRLGRTKE